MTPSSGVIAAGIIAVVAGSLAATIAFEAARRTRNWLYLLCVAGAVAFVAGVVGQRTFPNEDEVARRGQAVAANETPGPWDAGVNIPVVDVKLTPVAVGGFLLAIAGLSLVLFFEPTTPPRPAGAGRPLIEDDIV